MKAPYKSLKVNYNGEIKRMNFPLTFEELKRTLPKVYKDLTTEEIKTCTISYIDDEEDKVLISNDFDLEQVKMFMEKAKIDVLKIFIDLSESEKKLDDSMKFEMINELDKEKSHISMEKVERTELEDAGNNNKLIDDIIVQSLNEMRLSTDFAKSEVFSQGDKEFLAESHEEECKELVRNIQEKLVIDNANEKFNKRENEMVEDKKKEETEKLLGKKTNKEFNLYEYLMEKIKEVPPFEAMIEFIMQKRNEIKKKVNNSLKELSVEKVKKSVRRQIAKSVRNELKLTEKKILATLYKEADEHVEKIFNSKMISLNQTEIQKNKLTCLAIHSNVRCDGCNKKPIIGSRFKCSICEDFDYCEECEEKNKDNHNHSFIKIRKPELQPTKIITVVEDNKNNLPKVADKFENVKNKMKNYADKYIQYSGNISNDLHKIFDKIKLEGPKFFNELKPNKKIFDLFDCKEKKKETLNIEKKSNDVSQNKSVQADPNIKLSSKCISNNLLITTVNNTNEVRKSIKLLNDGQHSWPKFCYFTCIEQESTIKGVNVPIKVKVEPSKEINIEICLDLKQVKENGVYQSVWELQNEKREAFGQKVTLNVDAKFTNDLKVDSRFHQNGEELFPKERKVMTCAELLKEKLNPQLSTENNNLNRDKAVTHKQEINYTALMNHLKSTYDLQGIGDNRILYALVRARGNTDIALDNLISGGQNNNCNYHQKHFN